MPAAAALLPDDDALWRPWADLTLDLRDISLRLHATTDYVRFHATCKPWRDTLPPPPCYPSFLPWLLVSPDFTKHRKARCVFSSSMSPRRGTSAATEISVPDKRWVISTVDGTAVSTLTSICSGSGPGPGPGPGPSGGGLTDPLTGSAASALATPLPLLTFSCDDETKWWVDNADGVVCAGGTIFLYLFGPVHRTYYLPAFNAAILRPGDAAWTMVHKQCMGVSFTRDDPRSCIAYHDGKIVARDRYDWRSSCVDTRRLYHPRSETPLPSHQYGKALKASYLLESRGELLLANVLADCADGYTIASFVEGLSVSVHALQEVEGGKTQWVKRDGQSMADRLMFLGSPTSFAVDAALFGVISGGCAYFVIKSELYGGVWSKSAVERCHVFKYSFKDDRSELVEQLPAEWDKDACMWLTPPQPSIASTEEIRERLKPSNGKAGGPQFGPYFRIYVSNLPRNVDSYRLGQFFSKYGKVTEARVMCHIKTKRSRGFGFVTLATIVDHEQEHAIANLDRQILDGCPVRVKLADQKQQPDACLLSS